MVILTERELLVLRFLPSHLANAEIARECFMSVNTVKDPAAWCTGEKKRRGAETYRLQAQAASSGVGGGGSGRGADFFDSVLPFLAQYAVDLRRYR